MRILVLGGSVFLSRAIAAEAARRGHDVVAACRGTSSVPGGVEHVPLDRADPAWSAVVGQFDAAVETQSVPTWVRGAQDALADRVAHWSYVSSISAYADTTTPGGGPDSLPLEDPVDDPDDERHPATYGGRKVACERLVTDRAGQVLVLRPGLIVGPGDPTGRFTYWPLRLADLAPGSQVLAPGSPDDPVQVVDVRDQARWQVDAIEQGLVGVYDVTAPATTMAALLAEVAAGVGADVEPVWVDGAWLVAHDVEPWMGERSVPLWLPQPDYAGMVAHDVSPTLAAGLDPRPVGRTAADTLAWATDHRRRTGEDVPTTGITRDEELALLADWHATPRARHGP